MSSISTDGGYQFYQKNLGDLESEMRDETRRARERYDERASDLEKRTLENRDRLEKKTQETTDKIRENSSDAVAKDREYARQEVERQKAQSYDRFGRTQAEAASAQKYAAEAIKQDHESLENEKQKLNYASQRAVEKLEEGSHERMMENARAERESRTRENDQLREMNKRLTERDREFVRGKNEGIVAAHREVENEARTRENVITRQYEGQIDQMKQKARETDRAFGRLSEEQKLSRENDIARTIQRINQQHQDDRKYLEQNTEHAIAEAHELSRLDSENSQNAMARLADGMSKASAESLEAQADINRKELADQKLQSESEINRLQGEITGHITSGDPMWVAPEAEARMRNDFLKEYDNKHKAEVTRNSSKTDSIQREYQKRLSDTISESDRKLMRSDLDHKSAQHIQELGFVNHITEVEEAKNQAIRDKDYQSQHEAESLSKSHEAAMERQRGQYEDLMNHLRIEANEKIANIRQKAEFDSKIAQRNFATQQYDAIKAHERKMEEQKTFYEDTVSNLKDQLAKQAHEAEHRTRQLLDDQAKGYDQKIAEMEYQSKDRERTLTENYQDQIEKLKRSNALLAQRKS